MPRSVLNPEDLIRVRHMIDAVREALAFAQGKSRNELEHDRMLALAIIKELEIIGEAAGKVSAEARAAYTCAEICRSRTL